MLRYHNITKDDMLNGDGLRVVLWLAGCEHHCKGCQNPLTWNPDGGLEFDQAAKDELFEALGKNYISGLTLSGGDPMLLARRGEVLALVKEVKEKYPEKTIWVYSGYTHEELLADKTAVEILNFCDVLVDGKFVEELKDVKYHWAGSTNQRVIRLR